MTTVVFVAVYAGLLIFLAGCVRRIVQYSRVPRHLRWELYPVPHEDSHRVAHGGSYFEASDWWTEPRHFNLAGELRAMFAEIVFLKALHEFNRRLWYPSFVFHFGLYSGVATIVLAALRTAIELFAPSLAGTAALATLARLYQFTGLLGAVFIFLGALGLLTRRLGDRSMREYTTASDIFNLLFFMVVVACLAVGYLLQPAGATITATARGVVTFDTSIRTGSLFGVGVILASVLVAYIPFTHMSHFIAKYFTYHAVRWDDEQNRRGSALEKDVDRYLGYKPTWAAAHMRADGTKTWADLAVINPAREDRK